MAAATVAVLASARKSLVRTSLLWQDAGMRGAMTWAAGLLVAVLPCGCGGEVAASAANDDTLILEVGGDQPSLRAALVGLGRDVGTPQQLVERGPQGGAVPPVGPAGPTPVEPGPAWSGPVGPGPVEPDPVPPQPDPEPVAAHWLYVELQEGQTLIHVAREQLGDGRRFHELMEWNGWDENDARRLRTGQKVKILASAARDSQGR